MVTRDDVLLTIELIADTYSSDEPGAEQMVVERLIDQSYDALQAELLIAFVPLGLARPVIKRIKADPPVIFSKTALIRDFVGDRWLEVRIADVPEFVIANELSEETFQTGIIPREILSRICGVSVEMNCINQALYAGDDIAGGTLGPPVLMRLAEVPGFEAWYEPITYSNRRPEIIWRITEFVKAFFRRICFDEYPSINLLKPAKSIDERSQKSHF